MRTHRKPGGKAGKNYQKWVAALGLACVAPAAASAAPPAPAAPAAVSNQQTADAVAGSLKSSGLRGRGIEIVVREGVCRLTGTVPDARMKELATWAASQVGGVASVDNAMTIDAPAATPAVTPAAAAGGPAVVRTVAASEPAPVAPAAAAPVSNQAVAQRIAIAVQQAGLAGYDMEIRYKDGTCTLAGQVADQSQIDAALAAARGVSGVRSVANGLSVPSAAAAARQVASPMAAPGPLSRQDVARRRAIMQQRALMSGQIPPQALRTAAAGYGMPPGAVRPAGAQIPGGPGCPTPANPAGAPGLGAGAVYNQASLPEYAWPTYAQHPNYAAVSYPKDYSASAWPYIGPFYPYPQVPLGWREVELEWDDGQWYLDFNDRTDRWWWFLSPENW